MNSEIPDSLKASGKHGYYTRWFIAGRIRTSQIFSALPFEAKVDSLNPELLNRKINFILPDSLHYKIRYTVNETHPEIAGEFERELRDDNIRLLMTKQSGKSYPLNQLKGVNYLFEVRSY
jgi:hypothetical protein